jgi:hypothetical protein
VNDDKNSCNRILCVESSELLNRKGSIGDVAYSIWSNVRGIVIISKDGNDSLERVVNLAIITIMGNGHKTDRKASNDQNHHRSYVDSIDVNYVVH